MSKRDITIIFDMDGTLIDTEKYFRVCWPKAAKHFGYHMTDEPALSLRSLGRPYAPAKFKEMFGEDVDYDKIRTYRKILMEAELSKNGLELMPGAKELLIYLKENNVKTAVATASDLGRTKRYLSDAGILEYFDELISATMVEKGKPAPDIYLYACNELGIDPENVYAVEDSPNGVLSAFRAGCKVIMVPNQTQPDEDLSKCLYAKADTLLDLKELV